MISRGKKKLYSGINFRLSQSLERQRWKCALQRSAALTLAPLKENATEYICAREECNEQLRCRRSAFHIIIIIAYGERDGADWVVDFDIALLYSVSTRDGTIHYPHARPANIVLVEVPIWLSVIYQNNQET